MSTDIHQHESQSQTKDSESISHWQIIAPVKKQIYFSMAIMVLSIIFSLLALSGLAYLIKDLYLNNGVDWGWFLGILLLVVLSYISRGIAFKRSHLAAFALEPILRKNIAEHLTKVSLGSFSDHGSSAFAKVIQDDIRELHAFVADSTPLYAKAYASPLLTFVVLLWFDWRLALVALSVLVIGMTILGKVMGSSHEIEVEYNQAREDVNASVVEFVQAMPVVRNFDGGETSFGRYESALTHYLNVLLRWYRENGTPARLSMIILNPMPTLLVLVWFGAYWVWQDSLSFDVWLAVLLLGTGMAEALMPYMALYHLIEKAKISVRRIIEVQQLPELSVPNNPQEPKDASVTFEAVDFCYGNRQKNALNHISFHVPSGSFTALVGGSGAGKTTVARLIPRFWDVTAGSVKIGGVDVREMTHEVLMQQVAFVFQDNFLFSGTVKDNIKLGLENKSDAEVIAAAKNAQVHEDIMLLPEGYETQVGERGNNLSGGQRQRITIARAILQNRPILVLDEATAFADAQNEALLMKALAVLMKDKTILMIAHRLKTIQHAEQILVFKQGCLVESGSPETLLQQEGEYASLWKAYQDAQHWKIGHAHLASNIEK